MWVFLPELGAKNMKQFKQCISCGGRIIGEAWECEIEDSWCCDKCSPKGIKCKCGTYFPRFKS